MRGDKLCGVEERRIREGEDRMEKLCGISRFGRGERERGGVVLI